MFTLEMGSNILFVGSEKVGDQPCSQFPARFECLILWYEILVELVNITIHLYHVHSLICIDSLCGADRTPCVNSFNLDNSVVRSIHHWDLTFGPRGNGQGQS
jgi:hypothetical protein